MPVFLFVCFKFFQLECQFSEDGDLFFQILAVFQSQAACLWQMLGKYLLNEH